MAKGSAMSLEEAMRAHWESEEVIQVCGVNETSHRRDAIWLEFLRGARARERFPHLVQGKHSRPYLQLRSCEAIESAVPLPFKVSNERSAISRICISDSAPAPGISRSITNCATMQSITHGP